MPICKGRFPLLVNILKSAISVRTKLGLVCEKGLTQNMRLSGHYYAFILKEKKKKKERET